MYVQNLNTTATVQVAGIHLKHQLSKDAPVQKKRAQMYQNSGYPMRLCAQRMRSMANIVTRTNRENPFPFPTTRHIRL